MKKFIVLFITSLSFNVFADQCYEEELLAQIKYESLLEQFMDSKYNNGRAKKFLNSVMDLSSELNRRLTTAKSKLFLLNYKKALAVPEIKTQFDNLLNQTWPNRILNYSWPNDKQIWVCESYNNTGYDSDSGKGNAYCALLNLPNFDMADKNLANDDELIKKVTFIHNGKNTGSSFTKNFGELDLNLSKEEYIKRASAPYCKQSVTTANREADVKVVESSSEVKDSASLKK